MSNFLLLVLFLLNNNQEMIVRVYTPDYSQLQQIDIRSLDIAGRKYNEYYDLVVTPQQYNKVLFSGLKNEIIVDNLDLLKQEFKGQYHSYGEVNTIIRNYASTYPSICILDSIGQSYENRWVYALKISDNPGIEDSTEPGILFDALHHAREWATIEVILFFADTLLSGYGNDPDITALINNNEIWLIPIVNVDGYIYDYPGQEWWRKNRKPYGGSIGTDPNRNYSGALNGDPHGDWCSIPPGASISNNPSGITFCGAYTGWADIVNNMINFYKGHNINVNITYHSYAEEIVWPWAYTTSTTNMKTPDSIAYENIANQMASRIQKIGGGNYVASGSLYPLTGSTDSWVYGFYHYIKGISCLSYTVEVGTSFYLPVVHLDDLVRENWEGALYFAQQADSIRENILADVPSPDFSIPDTIPTSYTLYWHPINYQWNDPDKWKLEHLENYIYLIDNIESGISNWELSGFTLSSTRSHSSSHSLYSGSSSNISNVAQTKYPYIVQNSDTFSFWCYYNLENNYDVSVAEISLDLNEWIQLDERYTGSSGGWIQKKYSLDSWEGKSVYFRLRTVTDGGTQYENFYVDDIYPVAVFSSISVIDSNITDTSYAISGLSEDVHYFRVIGHNARGWGNYSNVVKTVVSSSASVEEINILNPFYFNVNNSDNGLIVSYNLPNVENFKIQIFDLTGRKVDELFIINQLGNQTLKIESIRSSVFFVRLVSDNIIITEKIVNIQ